MSSNMPAEQPFQLERSLQLRLLDLVRASIYSGLTQRRPMDVDVEEYPSPLHNLGASFVTLKLDGELRGCIGTLEACRALAEDVAQNAFNAAFRDPRFAPVSSQEYSQLEIYISILGPAIEMKFTSESDLLGQLRPGVDGLILSDRGRRGTFLPAVWESLPEAEDFLRHLKFKAGLPADYWSPTLRVERYTTFSFM